MEAPEGSTDLFECRTCGNLGLGRGEITCCDGPMDRVRVEEGRGPEPMLGGLLRTVFDMSETELDLCLCVMEAGEVTTKRLAEETGYDRSVVSRHLRHLVELGVIEKRRRLLERGGHVYVYLPYDVETVRQNLRDAFRSWLARATPLVDEITREKVESIVEAGPTDSRFKIYER